MSAALSVVAPVTVPDEPVGAPVEPVEEWKPIEELTIEEIKDDADDEGGMTFDDLLCLALPLGYRFSVKHLDAFERFRLAVADLRAALT